LCTGQGFDWHIKAYQIHNIGTTSAFVGVLVEEQNLAEVAGRKCYLAWSLLVLVQALPPL
jgi:hypothetical protein